MDAEADFPADFPHGMTCAWSIAGDSPSYPDSSCNVAQTMVKSEKMGNQANRGRVCGISQT
jgi:hypothetical protein